VLSARFLLSTNIAICISPRALISNAPAVSVSLTWSETLPRVSRIRRSRTFRAEQMRREGYKVMVSRPEVIFHRAANGNLLEPFENLYVDLPNENLGDILQSIANRKGE